MLSAHHPTCRLCLTTKNVTVDIFKYEFNYLPRMIESCLPITVTEDDQLPKCICQTCRSKVTLFYEFRNQALQAQHRLMSLPGMVHVPFPQHVYPQAQQRFIPQHTNYDQYVSGNPCDQQEYEDLSEPVENFCEVVQRNDLHLSGLTETRASNPLVEGHNHSDPLQIVAIRSVKTLSPNLSQNQREVKMQEEDTSQSTRTELPKLSPTRRKSDLKDTLTNAAKKKPLVARAKSKLPPKKCSSPPSQRNDVKEDDDSLSDDDKFSCDKCHFTTKSQSSYIMHSKRHVRKYIVFCKECNVSFLNKTEMTNHNIEKHDAPQFQCAHCNDIFTSKNTLYNHIKSHDPSSMHICEICGKTYKKKNSYKRHINRNHLGASAKAQCAICERILSSKEHLRRHMLVHTDERNWVCATCGKCYRSKCYLTEHTRIHAGIKPYKCEICNKCFTQRGSLTIHKRSHTGERPFRCEYCDRAFIISTLLRYHVKKCSLAPKDVSRTEPVSVITSNSSNIVQS